MSSGHEVWGWAALEGADWSRLHHAYGIAADTPARVRSIFGADVGAAGEGLDHLDYSVVHQYSIYPATPVVVRVLGGLLGLSELRRASPASQGAPVLADVLGWLGYTAESAAGPGAEAANWQETSPLTITHPDPEEVESFYRSILADDDLQVWASRTASQLMTRAVQDVRDLAEPVIDRVTPFLEDADPAVRVQAVTALTRFARLAGHEGRRGVADRLRGRLTRLHDATAEGELPGAATGRTRDERATLVVGLGMLGGDTRAWVDDVDPAVRACAALSLRADPDATAVLVDCLTRPAEVDAWFTGGMPLQSFRPRFWMLSELLERSVPFVDLLPAAEAIAGVANAYTVDHDWGPLLRAAFPGPDPAPGRPAPAPTDLDEPQRAFLAALAANAELWDMRIGNVTNALRRVGLPQDRGAVARLAGVSTGRGRPSPLSSLRDRLRRRA